MNTRVTRPSDADRQGAPYDVLVVGGGAAGLSAALTLSRARRSVVVLDSGSPRNAPADGVHGLLGLEGIAPSELLARGRAEVESYGGEIRPGTVTDVATTPAGFRATLGDGSEVEARRLLIATGLVDELPDIPGVAEQWGSGVIHCPYCHGWEVRDQHIGVIATGPMSVHQALLFTQWSPTVTFFSGTAEIAEADRAQLDAAGVSVVGGAVTEVVSRAGGIECVTTEDGVTHQVDAVVVASRMVARLAPFASLGVSATEHPVGEFVETDATGRTGVPGVWAAGNASDLSAQVGAAAAEGVRVGAQINADLIFTGLGTSHA